MTGDALVAAWFAAQLVAVGLAAGVALACGVDTLQGLVDLALDAFVAALERRRGRP